MSWPSHPATLGLQHIDATSPQTKSSRASKAQHLFCIPAVHFAKTHKSKPISMHRYAACSTFQGLNIKAAMFCAMSAPGYENAQFLSAPSVPTNCKTFETYPPGRLRSQSTGSGSLTFTFSGENTLQLTSRHIDVLRASRPTLRQHG